MGPPNFWLIQTSPGAVRGALQQRQAPVEGRGMIGFECTIAVHDVHDVRAVADAVTAAGGTMVLPPSLIERVGTLIQFHDTEGVQVSAMQYGSAPG